MKKSMKSKSILFEINLQLIINVVNLNKRIGAIYFVMLFILLSGTIQIQAQNDSFLSKAQYNTFKRSHVNYWSLINIGSASDSIGIIEGFSGDTAYYEIEGQSKITQTKSLLLLIDEVEQLIYAMPKSAKAKKRQQLNLPDSLLRNFEADTSILISEGNFVYTYISEDAFWKMSIDTATNLINWFETNEERISNDYLSNNTGNETEKITIRFVLNQQIYKSAQIKNIISPNRFVTGKAENIQVTAPYKNYEFINMIN